MTKNEETYGHASEDRRENILLGLANAWDILVDAIRNYQYNGNTNQAAAISLYAILSFIPFFILTIFVLNYFFGTHPQIQKKFLEMIRTFHPYFSEGLLKQLGHIEQKKKILGWVGIISLVWFSSLIFSAIETAMNVIFRSGKSRNYFVSKLLAIAMIPTGWIVGVGSVGISYIMAILAKRSLVVGHEYSVFFYLYGPLFRYLIPFLLIVVFFAIVYKVIPTAKISLFEAFIGAVVFSALMEIAKHVFTWYLANYTSYDVIFGSLNTIVVLVIWVFYISIILLFCAELISSYRRRDLILLERAFLSPRKKLLRVDERLFRRFGRLYPKNTYIFKEGDTDNEMYYILEGHVQIEKKAGQVKKTLTVIGSGEYFGEIAALIDEPRTASARALDDTRIAVIDRNNFHNLIRSNDQVSLLMLKKFSKRIQHTNIDIEELTLSWVKLVIIIYFLMDCHFSEKNDPVEQLSMYTRKSSYEIRQVLLELDKQGVLTMKNGRVIDFSVANARNILVNQIFYSERRKAKREDEIKENNQNDLFY